MKQKKNEKHFRELHRTVWRSQEDCIGELGNAVKAKVIKRGIAQNNNCKRVYVDVWVQSKKEQLWCKIKDEEDRCSISRFPDKGLIEYWRKKFRRMRSENGIDQQEKIDKTIWLIKRRGMWQKYIHIIESLRDTGRSYNQSWHILQ